MLLPHEIYEHEPDLMEKRNNGSMISQGEPGNNEKEIRSETVSDRPINHFAKGSPDNDLYRILRVIV